MGFFMMLKIFVIYIVINIGSTKFTKKEILLPTYKIYNVTYLIKLI